MAGVVACVVGRRAVASYASTRRGRARDSLACWAGHVHVVSLRDFHGSTRRDGSSTLVATVAAVRELVVVKTARQLSLLEVGSNVLVWHLLESSLNEI